MTRTSTISTCITSITLALSITGLVTGAIASTPTRPTTVASIRFVPPPPPDQGRPPGNRRGGASRGDCPSVNPHLTALAPVIEQTPSAVWGLTSLERPTFWFYSPYVLSSDHPAEFVLLDEQNNYVYRGNLTNTNNQTGIIRVPLPDTMPPLEIGKTYQWAFLVYCDIDDPTFTRGSIERVALDSTLASQLNQASPIEAATLYAANGIWYEAVNTLAELHLANPENEAIATEWRNLLRSAGLTELAEQPILPCCSPQ